MRDRLLVCARPAALLLTSCEVLGAVNDPRAPQALAAACAEVRAMAAQITDPQMREGFLSTPLNRELLSRGAADGPVVDLRAEQQPAQPG